jgi:hypothetical protein
MLNAFKLNSLFVKTLLTLYIDNQIINDYIMKRLTLIISILAISFAACVKEAGTASSQLSYSFGATNLSASLSNTTASGAVVSPLSNGSISWSGMTVNISKIDVTAKLAGKEVALESKDILAINPLKPDQLLGTVPIDAGVYENVKFKLTMAESASNPPFLLNGTYTEASGTKIPVEIQLNQSQLFTLEVPKFEVIKGARIAKITFQLNELVKGLTASDFGQTTRTGSNNTILVTSKINRALYEKLSIRLANISSVTVN